MPELCKHLNFTVLPFNPKFVTSDNIKDKIKGKSGTVKAKITAKIGNFCEKHVSHSNSTDIFMPSLNNTIPNDKSEWYNEHYEKLYMEYCQWLSKKAKLELINSANSISAYYTQKNLDSFHYSSPTVNTETISISGENDFQYIMTGKNTPDNYSFEDAIFGRSGRIGCGGYGPKNNYEFTLTQENLNMLESLSESPNNFYKEILSCFSNNSKTYPSDWYKSVKIII